MRRMAQSCAYGVEPAARPAERHGEEMRPVSIRLSLRGDGAGTSCLGVGSLIRGNRGPRLSAKVCAVIGGIQ